MIFLCKGCLDKLGIAQPAGDAFAKLRREYIIHSHAGIAPVIPGRVIEG
ncbi:hypothetical protein [Mesorhizobium sp. CO1-1-8]|nr:hypothetical protein [Mesorhizobium sp. CO1-1-8]MBZ9771465.1 hypothetical protein [Mesorhizobium sp. CO1-1-8]